MPRTLALPETIQAVLAARLDRLPPAAKALAQVAAVMGAEVPGVLLQAVTALADTTLPAPPRAPAGAEFLYEARSVPEPVYAFKHALTHEAAYQSLLRQHAAALSPADCRGAGGPVCRHGGDPARGAWRITTLRRAPGEQAVALLAAGRRTRRGAVGAS